MSSDGEENGQKQAGGRSLRRAFSLLEAVAATPDGMSLGELAKAAELHTSTTFHLLKTLLSLGYVRRNEATKRYFVGARLFALAAGAADEVELINICTPVLESLAGDTGETSHLAVPSGGDVVIIAKFDSAASVRITERIGAVRPAYATAIGKVILADLSDERLDQYLAHHSLESYTPKTVTDPALIKAEIEKVRRRGAAFDDCEFNPEVRCIAAPIHDFADRLVGAVGISGPIWRMNLPDVGALEQQVRESARVISARLGRPEKEAHLSVVTATGD